MNTMQKNRIKDLCSSIYFSKVAKRKERERAEFGQDADKIDMKVFVKIIQRENQESDSEIKEFVRRLMKSKSSNEFAKMIQDSRKYSDADFLKDVKSVFDDNSTLFIQKELEYAAAQ